MASITSVPVTAPRATVPRQAPAPRRRFGARERHDFLVFLAFAAPNILLIVAFTYRPLLSNIYYSTLNWTLGATTAVTGRVRQLCAVLHLI